VVAPILAVGATGCAQLLGLDDVEVTPAATFAPVVASSATELVVDGEDLFWTTSTSVQTCVLASCEPKPLVEGLLFQPRALSVLGTEVRYATGGRAYRVDRSGSAAPTLLIDQPGNGQPLFDIAQTGNALFLTHDRLSYCKYELAGPCSGLSAIADVVKRDLALDSTGRLWGTGTDSAVHVARADNAQISFPLATPTVPRALLPAAATMFVLQGSDEILQWPTATVSPTEGVVALRATSPAAMASDGSDLWVATANGELWRRPLIGSADDALLAGTATVPITAIAVTQATVLVALPAEIASFQIAP